MRSKIENHVGIICSDIDLQTLSSIEFYVRQGKFFRIYTPEVVSANKMVVVIPMVDAMELQPNKMVDLQFAYTDENGIPDASDIVSMNVRDLLKESGYDPI